MNSLLTRVARSIGVAVFAAAGIVTPAIGAQDFSAICEVVAAEASHQTGVPISVLKAISLNETGRKQAGAFRPWPWTVNMEGEGHWFDSQDDARAYVFKEFKRGARSFDVGCFQINYKWHGQEFDSIDAMFDPLENAIYAAKFLKDLYAETGTWSKAAGAFHSRTPALAEKYATRFDGFRANFVKEDGSSQRTDHLVGAPATRSKLQEIPDIVLAAYGDQPLPIQPRVNSYPLLQTGSVAGLSSLVPLGQTSAASLFAPARPVVVE